MAGAAPLLTLTVTGLPTTVLPLRRVNVAVPPLTVPAELVTEALRYTDWLPTA